MSKTVKLVDICTPKQWKTIGTSELLDSGFPVYGANGIIGYYNNYNHEKETLLITCRGATCGEINISQPKSYINGNAMCLDNLSDKFSLKFLYYYLKWYDFNNVISGSAQPQITIIGLNKVNVPNISLEIQHRIAENLNKITHTIDLCNQILDRLDLLVKAKFVEMFGDPVSNPMGWEVKLLKKLTTKIGSGATPKGGRESYGTEGISLIRSMNVHNGYFQYKALAHISDKQAEKLDNVTIQENDVLLNITGASVARCCIVPSEILPARVNQHVCIIRCKTNVLPVFVSNILTNGNYQKYLCDIAGSGATREAITKQQIENFSIIVPPLVLQKQFTTFVEQVEKSKSAVKRVLEKAETLKRAFMQEYFG